MSRPARLGIAGALAIALAALLAWAASNTEWIEIEVPRALTGKAAQDDDYALQRLLEAAGARVVRHEGLERLPPVGATILLESWVWGVLPQRDQALREWVERGGRLALEASLLPKTTQARWIPVEPSGRWLLTEEEARSASGASTRRTKPRRPAKESLVVAPPCFAVSESAPQSPVFSDGGSAAPALQLCGNTIEPLEPKAPAQWSLQGQVWSTGTGAKQARARLETLVMRAPLGQGSVTVVPGFRHFENTSLLRGDNALVAVAALQAVPGASVWIVEGEAKGNLLAWLWRNAWAAVVLALVALAAWYWREAATFGPKLVAPPLARRSMAEQIRGTAAFVWRACPAVLHRAQLRALDDIAARRIRDYARLDRPDRADRIARATGLDPVSMLGAFQYDGTAARMLPQHLAVLETARRTLAAAALAVDPGVPHSPSSKEP
jgi:hypothetical protein